MNRARRPGQQVWSRRCRSAKRSNAFSQRGAHFSSGLSGVLSPDMVKMLFCVIFLRSSSALGAGCLQSTFGRDALAANGCLRSGRRSSTVPADGVPRKSPACVSTAFRLSSSGAARPNVGQPADNANFLRQFASTVVTCDLSHIGRLFLLLCSPPSKSREGCMRRAAFRGLAIAL